MKQATAGRDRRSTSMRPYCLAPLLLLAACGKPATDTPEGNAAAFVPPPTQVAKPLPGQEPTTPLTAYVGQYPTDAVAGVDFYDRTEVARALVDTVADPALRRRFTTRDAVTVPIYRAADGRIAAHGCTPHDCGDVNWTFLIAPDGSKGEACFHDAAAMGATSRWYAGGGTPTSRPGECPQE